MVTGDLIMLVLGGTIGTIALVSGIFYLQDKNVNDTNELEGAN